MWIDKFSKRIENFTLEVNLHLKNLIEELCDIAYQEGYEQACRDLGNNMEKKKA